TAYPRITCYAGNDLSEYTVVHELGHAFTYHTGESVTGSTFYGMIRNPPTGGAILDLSGGIVLGEIPDRENPNTKERGPDWTRGQRGWGSAARSIEFIPLEQPCDFQQNAYSPYDFEIARLPAPTQEFLARTETNETAADMFLNWVYSRITTEEMYGFKDRDYRDLVGDCVSAAPVDTTNPGVARFSILTDNILPTLATRFPTVTP
ncbi:MAG: hypothetical protein L6Q98_25390, partial [Anaerolineae bacterium]|nr:hypothetical protein [Anaerolineae bacterium]